MEFTVKYIKLDELWHLITVSLVSSRYFRREHTGVTLGLFPK